MWGGARTALRDEMDPPRADPVSERYMVYKERARIAHATAQPARPDPAIEHSRVSPQAQTRTNCVCHYFISLVINYTLHTKDAAGDRRRERIAMSMIWGGRLPCPPPRHPMPLTFSRHTRRRSQTGPR